MNGQVFPEISAMSNAQIGGYLSKGAATQLAAFKTKAGRRRFTFKNFTATESEARKIGTTCTIAYASREDGTPEGYTAIGAIGFNIPDRGWGGMWANAERGQVYSQAGLYCSSTIQPTIQILFKRT